jgi:hypothetical protein
MPRVTILSLFVALCCSAHAQGPAARMHACNEQAGALSGDERKAFIIDCLQKSTPATPSKPSKPSASRDPGKDPAHRQGICNEIKKLDLLLYDDPSHHAPTTECSYTDARLLITARSSLTPDRMKRFTLLAFASVGRLYNDDFALPAEVYAGYGTDCQVMTSSDAALLHRELRRGDDSGMIHALQMTSGAKRVPCPK